MTTTMSYMPALPDDLREQLQKCLNTGSTGVAQLYSPASSMMLVAQVVDGALVGWTLAHPWSPEDAERHLAEADGEWIGHEVH